MRVRARARARVRVAVGAWHLHEHVVGREVAPPHALGRVPPPRTGLVRRARELTVELARREHLPGGVLMGS